LRVCGQRHENLTGRSPASLDMVEIFVKRCHCEECLSVVIFTSRNPAAANSVPRANSDLTESDGGFPRRAKS
jgi:hypothetical protein